MAESYSTADVGKHKDEANGYWLIVENDVYDVTSTFITICSMASQSRCDRDSISQVVLQNSH